MVKPKRGEIWLVDLNPVRGHEQAGKRPALVISIDLFKAHPDGKGRVENPPQSRLLLPARPIPASWVAW
nr:type II toxin-antitoxin system PemK/MazF family toxin [Desulfofundulus thermosubterraneus]